MGRISKKKFNLEMRDREEREEYMKENYGYTRFNHVLMHHFEQAEAKNDIAWFQQNYQENKTFLEEHIEKNPRAKVWSNFNVWLKKGKQLKKPSIVIEKVKKIDLPIAKRRRKRQRLKRD